MDRQELVIEDDSSVDSDSEKASPSSISPSFPQSKPTFPITIPPIPLQPQPPVQSTTKPLLSAGPNSRFFTRPAQQRLPRTQRKLLRPLTLTTRRKLRPSLSLLAQGSDLSATQSMLRKQFQTSFPCRENGIPAYDAKQDKHLRAWRSRKQTNSASKSHEIRVKRRETDLEMVKLPPIRQKSTPGIDRSVRESSENASRGRKTGKN